MKLEGGRKPAASISVCFTNFLKSSHKKVMILSLQVHPMSYISRLHFSWPRIRWWRSIWSRIFQAEKSEKWKLPTANMGMEEKRRLDVCIRRSDRNTSYVLCICSGILYAAKLKRACSILNSIWKGDVILSSDIYICRSNIYHVKMHQPY